MSLSDSRSAVIDSRKNPPICSWFVSLFGNLRRPFDSEDFLFQLCIDTASTPWKLYSRVPSFTCLCSPSCFPLIPVSRFFVLCHCLFSFNISWSIQHSLTSNIVDSGTDYEILSLILFFFSGIKKVSKYFFCVKKKNRPFR